MNGIIVKAIAFLLQLSTRNLTYQCINALMNAHVFYQLIIAPGVTLLYVKLCVEQYCNITTYSCHIRREPDCDCSIFALLQKSFHVKLTTDDRHSQTDFDIVQDELVVTP